MGGHFDPSPKTHHSRASYFFRVFFSFSDWPFFWMKNSKQRTGLFISLKCPTFVYNKRSYKLSTIYMNESKIIDNTDKSSTSRSRGKAWKSHSGGCDFFPPIRRNYVKAPFDWNRPGTVHNENPNHEASTPLKSNIPTTDPSNERYLYLHESLKFRDSCR